MVNSCGFYQSYCFAKCKSLTRLNSFYELTSIHFLCMILLKVKISKVLLSGICFEWLHCQRICFLHTWYGRMSFEWQLVEFYHIRKIHTVGRTSVALCRCPEDCNLLLCACSAVPSTLRMKLFFLLEMPIDLVTISSFPYPLETLPR